jgi:hypothetical protein
MAKIRDLGIGVIPGTMRPPEIGGGGGFGDYRLCGVDTGRCEACQESSNASCDAPSGACGPCGSRNPETRPPADQGKGDKKDEKKEKYAGPFTGAAVAQLKAQLRHRLDNRV